MTNHEIKNPEWGVSCGDWARLGRHVKAAREERSLTRASLSVATRIDTQQLEHLEEGHLSRTLSSHATTDPDDYIPHVEALEAYLGWDVGRVLDILQNRPKRLRLEAPVMDDSGDPEPSTSSDLDGPWEMIPAGKTTEEQATEDLAKLAQERDLALIAGYRQSIDFLCSLVDDHKVSPVLVNEAIRDLQGVFCTALRPLNP